MSNYDYQEDPKDKKSDDWADTIMAVLLGAWVASVVIIPLLVKFGVI